MATRADPLSCELYERISQANGLLEHCRENVEVQGKEKLVKKIQAELSFLKKLTSSAHLKADHIRSSNLTHLSSIVKCCSEMEGTVKILEPFIFSQPDDCHTMQKRLIVDIVCDHGKTWVKVIARNPLALLQLSTGNGKFGQKSVTEHIKDMIDCAQQNKFMFQPPKVKVWFSGCFLQELKDLLDDMNVEIVFSDQSTIYDSYPSYQRIALSAECLKSELDVEKKEMEHFSSSCNVVHKDECFGHSSHAQCDMTLCSIPDSTVLNLDVSTMIAHVSNLTNGHAWAKFDEAILNEQAARERISPVRNVLTKLFSGHKLTCCSTAFADFKDIVSVVGGMSEKQRALQFEKEVTVIPDNPSGQAMMLQASSRVKPRSKIIFGTGDTCKAITVTANFGFLRAAQGQGVKFVAVFHESRALSEMKELPV